MLEPEATRQQEQAVLNNIESTPNIIYIYNDEGAGENSVKYILDTLTKIATAYKINFINAQDILAKEWIKNAVLLVMPGGADIPYTKKLNGERNKIIKEYVENVGEVI
ncbi:BPL-N domain-containing protein [Rickettsia endosymbiont of Gonocerus acuteangulatus]|uniref:BPL-N domain-containing protein n=1 Tax=Rickettsia endosymbiont of Gonocerus acuteangulatus TaxID=3066266 RepID=UPI003132CA83